LAYPSISRARTTAVHTWTDILKSFYHPLERLWEKCRTTSSRIIGVAVSRPSTRHLKILPKKRHDSKNTLKGGTITSTKVRLDPLQPRRSRNPFTFGLTITGNEVADVLGELEKPEMIEFYKLFIMPTSLHRTKLSLHLEPKTPPPPPNVPKADGGAEPGTVTYIEDLHEWKSKMPREKLMWPLVSQDKLMELWSVK